MTDALAQNPLVLLLSALSLAAVWVPLYRGTRLCLRARGATRRLGPQELERRLRGAGSRAERVEPLAVVMLRVLHKSLVQGDEERYPSEFVLDASRQYATHEFEAHYARLISMYANLLPPIGFIGTTCGLLVLLGSMALSDKSLEVGGLALALTSSIFALIGFACLEALRIRLYGRLLAALDEVVALQRQGGLKPQAPVS